MDLENIMLNKARADTEFNPEIMESKQKYKVIGLMSGTSLDGLDIASCVFTNGAKGWQFDIQQAQTIRYPKSWADKLSGAHLLSGEALIDADVSYGNYLGKATAAFIAKHKLRPDFIASHGHTIFHQPRKGFTYQIGNGNAIYAATGIPVVYDFRSLDVMLGGEGAPLVPAGDKFLFHEYDVCLNLGGIANLSMDIGKERKAFDICFTNMGLNYLASKAGKPFDNQGDMASQGEVNKTMLRALDKIYASLKTKRPSLGREIFEQRIKPLLDNVDIPVFDRLCTFTESIAREITSAVLAGKKNAKVMCTGGGAFNAFLLSRMLDIAGDDATFILPDEEIIKFKEALVFAFLGVLRVRDEVNCLKSVTGASRNCSGGILAGF